jgi:flagellar L-ring protein FlgH
MKKFISLMIAVILLVPVLPAYSDSVWSKNSNSPYSTAKSFKAGDIITVIILETTSAVQKAGTDTNTSDNLSASFDHTITRLGIQPSNYIKGGGGATFKGLGATTRTSNVTAKVAAVVIQVFPNGNLMISGDHKVEVNEETQTIRITGIIRPKDVSIANTVFSYQVASAVVSVRGKGSVGEAEEPGFITRFFNWIF